VTASTPEDQVPAAMTVKMPGAPDETDRFTDTLGLVRLSHLVRAAFARAADRHDLTPLQGRLLCDLAAAPKGMAELARQFGVEKAALTGLVDRAERRGLVERRSVPGDRRAVSVALTPTGRRAAAEFHAEATAELEQILAPLAPAQRASFRTALAAITRTAGPADGCGPRTAC
jgi:DNA-binding MarR family transcriptional regulator